MATETNSALRTELAQLREAKAQALSVAYTEIASLRKQLADAEELVNKTQSFETAELRNENVKLKRELAAAQQATERERQRAGQVDREAHALREQLAQLQQELVVAKTGSQEAKRPVLRALSPNKASQESETTQTSYRERYERLLAEHDAMCEHHERDRTAWRRYKKHLEEVKANGVASKSTSPKRRKRSHRQSSPRQPEPALLFAGGLETELSTLKLSPARPLTASIPVSSRPLQPSAQPADTPVRSPPKPSPQISDTKSHSSQRRRLVDEDAVEPMRAMREPARKRRKSSHPTETTPKAQAKPVRMVETPGEDFPGQFFMREIHRQRKADVLENPAKYKIRTPTSAGGQRSINADYEIDASRNMGEHQPFVDVERRKAERKRMHGNDCDCCRDYYAIANANDDDRIKQHRQSISRHRSHWNAPPTPPGYWQMGFPNTQQVEALNREAAELEQRKRDRIEAELACVRFFSTTTSRSSSDLTQW